MQASIKSKSTAARAIVAAVCGLLCGFALAAPVLGSHSCEKASSFLYLIFSRVCHQIPERSFALSGLPLALCHRCFGICLGLSLGSILRNPFKHRGLAARRFFLLAATVPLLLDALLPFTGLWTGTPLSRFLTGLLFGSLTSSLLVSGIAELLDEAPWQRLLPARRLSREAFHE